MVTLTAILKCAAEQAPTLEAALLELVAYVRAQEPDTLGYFVSRGVSENGRAVFTTYERYASGAALEQHNGSAAVARFFDVAAPLLSEPATVVVAEELAAMEITAERSGRFHSNNQSGR